MAVSPALFRFDVTTQQRVNKQLLSPTNDCRRKKCLRLLLQPVRGQELACLALVSNSIRAVSKIAMLPSRYRRGRSGAAGGPFPDPGLCSDGGVPSRHRSTSGRRSPAATARSRARSSDSTPCSDTPTRSVVSSTHDARLELGLRRGSQQSLDDVDWQERSLPPQAARTAEEEGSATAVLGAGARWVSPARSTCSPGISPWWPERTRHLASGQFKQSSMLRRTSRTTSCPGGRITQLHFLLACCGRSTRRRKENFAVVT